MSDKRVIFGTREGMVAMDSPEGKEVAERKANQYFQQKEAKRQEIMTDLESRGMEPLAKTESRLMTPLKERLAAIARERKQTQGRLANPMAGLTLFAGPNGFDPETVDSQVRSFAQKQQQSLEALDKEEVALLKTVEAVSTGMRALAEGKKPAAEFMRHLGELEAEAAREVGYSAQRGGVDDEKQFAAIREQLKALADLRGFAESL